MSISDPIDRDFPYTSQIRSFDESKMNIENSNPVISRLGEIFITNPGNEYFKGYPQDYYCCVFPTLSGEEKLLTGVLKLKAGSFYCEADLRLDTSQTKKGKN